MHQPALPRLGAACGAIFAIVLTVAAGDGSQPFSTARAVAGVAAIALALPFIAYLCSVLRQAEGPDGWLASTALAAGIGGIVIKLGSVVPELAVHRAHLAAGTPLKTAITAAALVINGAFLSAAFLPALLLFLLWTVLASVYLLRQTWRSSAPATRTEAVARA